MPPRYNPRSPYRSGTRKKPNPKRKGRGTPLLDLIRGVKKGANKNPRFDPGGTGYDYEAAKIAGLGPDEKGHWPSRVPATGQILKGTGHKTYGLTEEGEKAAGHTIRKDPNTGKRYSEMVEGIGKGWRARGDTQEERAKSFTGATAKKIEEKGGTVPEVHKPFPEKLMSDLEGKTPPDMANWFKSGAAARGVTAPSSFDPPSSGEMKFPAGFLQPSMVDKPGGGQRRITAKEVMAQDPSERTLGDKRALRLLDIQRWKANRATAQTRQNESSRGRASDISGRKPNRTFEEQRKDQQAYYDASWDTKDAAKKQAIKLAAQRKADRAQRDKDKKAKNP